MRTSAWLVSAFLVAACGASERGNWTASTQACELVDGQLEVACSAPAVPSPSSTSIATAPLIEDGTTYSVTSPSDRRAYVAFRPARTGLHTIYFGTEEEMQVCDLTAACASTTTCPTLPVVARYAMDAGVRYEIEILPGASDLRLRIEPPADDMPPPAGADIVFAAALDGQAQPDLYRMHADGSGLVRLTTTSGAELYPTWSPARDRIAFVRDFQLFVRDADGSNERLVAPMTGRVRMIYGMPYLTTLSHASWSPDGTQLVYPYPLPPLLIEEEPGQFVDEAYGTTLHIIEVDGTGDHAIPNLNEESGEFPFGTSYAPVWGTDDRILFEMDDDCPDCAGGIGQGSIRPDGSDFLFVTELGLDIVQGLDALAGSWVFVGDTNGWNYEGKGTLYTAPAYGTARTPLPTAPAWSPHWSPDAASIAYIADDGIHVIGADGTGARRILPAANVRGLDW